MKKPKLIWIILDSLDGVHVFGSERSAWKTYKKWETEANKDMGGLDSFWNMSEPIEYVLKPKK